MLMSNYFAGFTMVNSGRDVNESASGRGLTLIKFQRKLRAWHASHYVN
jgi:hypothetical protein